MRVTGVTEAARGYGRDDRLCRAFDELGEFHLRALEFLTDALRFACEAGLPSAARMIEMLDLADVRIEVPT